MFKVSDQPSVSNECNVVVSTVSAQLRGAEIEGVGFCIFAWITQYRIIISKSDRKIYRFSEIASDVRCCVSVQ